MKIVRMKKEWDFDDSSIYRLGKYSSEALDRYWQSLDQAVRHWDTFISMKKTVLPFTGKKENISANPYQQDSHRRNFRNQSIPSITGRNIAFHTQLLTTKRREENYLLLQDTTIINFVQH